MEKHHKITIDKLMDAYGDLAFCESLCINRGDMNQYLRPINETKELIREIKESMEKKYSDGEENT